jgi:phage terminase large subunit
VLQQKAYIYDTCWLPHDAKAKRLGTKRTIEEQIRAAGSWNVRVVPRHSVADGINAARTLFPNCYFDQGKCEEGVKALRSYRYEVIPNTQTFSTDPVHDWSSHGADAFRYLALALREPKKPRQSAAAKAKSFFLGNESPQGWMR